MWILRIFINQIANGIEKNVKYEKVGEWGGGRQEGGFEMLLILSVNEIKFLGFLNESVECATVITGSQRRQHKIDNFFEFQKKRLWYKMFKWNEIKR